MEELKTLKIENSTVKTELEETKRVVKVITQGQLVWPIDKLIFNGVFICTETAEKCSKSDQVIKSLKWV